MVENVFCNKIAIKTLASVKTTVTIVLVINPHFEENQTFLDDENTFATLSSVYTVNNSNKAVFLTKFILSFSPKQCRIFSGEQELFPLHSFKGDVCLDDRMLVSVLGKGSKNSL